MKKFFLAAIFIAALLLIYFLFFKEKGGNYVSVLVFSKTEAFRHESIESGQEMFKQLSEQKGFKVQFSENAEDISEEVLKDVNVVVFLSTTGDILDPKQQLELNRYIQAGGGFMGIHAAADTEYDWPYYNQLVGAYFESHPNNPNVREASIDRVDHKHVSTAHLPERWTREDEWYNYKSISQEINVLLNLDETSYEGGTNGENHPISWYREFDGGRMWYTGLGHTKETYSDPLFIDHVWGGLEYAAGPKVKINYDNANVAPEENRFTKVVLDDNLDEPMELVLLPNNNLLFVQRGGKVLLHDQAEGKTSEMYEFNVFSGLEDGLLGVALDPQVETNKHIYFFYSHPTDTVQVVSRFVMADDYNSFDPESETQLIKIPTQRLECCHSAGSMEFGPDGMLYIATGDNTNPHASDGYSPHDDRPGRNPWDALKSAGNTNDLRGKVLRIKVEADGYSIPDGNLFPKDGSGGRPEVYVMGCRNPYRLAFDERRGYLYWGDVGPDANEDSLGRGPKGHDEINQARAAGNFGWPLFIADNKPYHAYDWDTQTSGEAFDPQAPVNNSRNNTGAKTLPPAQSAMFWYGYGSSDEFPLLGNGGRTAMAGPTFYADDYPESESRFPDYYDGKLFIYEWMRGWMIAVTLDEEGNYKRMERFLPNLKLNNPTDIVMSPEGDMYLLEYGSGWFRQNPDARLVHLTYTGGNRTPVAKIEADNQYGKLPFEVSLDGQSSIDYDGDDLSYEWKIGEDMISTEATVNKTFEQAGEYLVSLTVADPDGKSGSTTINIKAGNALPEVKWSFEGNQTFYWDNHSIQYSVAVSDDEDGKIGQGISENDVTVTIDYLKQGADMNEIALGHEALTALSVGKSLIEGSDCMACHHNENKSIGPAYKQVAERYADDPNAKPYLSDKIRNGGSGAWGETAMAAHPQMTEEEAGMIVDYILSLGQATKGVASSGSYTFTDHVGQGNEGSYIFNATYTDKGGNGIGSLTAGDTKVLRYPLIMAADYLEGIKAPKFEVEAGAAPGVEEDLEIVIGSDGTQMTFGDIDFTGVNKLVVSIAQFPNYFNGGTLSIVADAPDGQVVASEEIVQGLTDMGEKKLEFDINIEGVHELYVVFSSEEGPVCAINYIEFLK